MSHFSRPMHLFSGYVSAREETRPVRSTPPPSPPPPSSSALPLSSPLFLLPSFAFGFIFNRATHHGTRRSQLCRVTRGASPSLSFSCLSSAYPPPAPFLFLFLSLRGGPFSPLFFFPFSLPPSRLRSFSLRQRRTGQPAAPWVRITHTFRVRLFTFKGKGRLALRVLLSSHVTVALVEIPGIIEIGVRRRNYLID